MSSRDVNANQPRSGEGWGVMESADGNGGVYVAMLLAGTVDLILFVAIYLGYAWWIG